MSRGTERLLEQLVQIAGDPRIVQEVLRALAPDLTDPDDIRRVIERVYELRATSRPAASSAGVKDTGRAEAAPA
jgi:hypothetical protein